MSDFRRLTVWQKAHRLTLDVYRATAAFPQSELYGLTSQMRRCCVSIGSNIAEACGRSGEIEKARFLGIERVNSNIESSCHAISAIWRPKTGHRIMQQVQEVGRMLSSLTEKVRAATA